MAICCRDIVVFWLVREVDSDDVMSFLQCVEDDTLPDVAIAASNSNLHGDGLEWAVRSTGQVGMLGVYKRSEKFVDQMGGVPPPAMAPLILSWSPWLL